MKTTVNNLPIEQMREIVEGAPEGATHTRQTPFGNFIYHKFENNELFTWIISDWYLSSNQEFRVIGVNSLRTAIASHSEDHEWEDIRNHVSPNCKIMERNNESE